MLVALRKCQTITEQQLEISIHCYSFRIVFAFQVGLNLMGDKCNANIALISSVL